MMRILKPIPPGGRTPAAVAAVSYSGSAGFGAVGDTELRDVPLCAPRGVDYRPCRGDRLLLLDAAGRSVCAGALCGPVGLAPGELRLSSAGGAVIQLKNSGDIVLNGVTITRSGEILAPGSAAAQSDTDREER